MPSPSSTISRASEPGPSDAAATALGGPTRTALVFWTGFVLFAALCVSWALASPIFSVPDENAHAVKAIAQVRGELVGHAEPGVRQLVVDVPPSYAVSQQLLCFAFHSETTANCGFQLGDTGGTDWSATWVSTYNPIYYFVVGWPSLIFGGSAGIYAMRVASALFGALFFAWALQAAVASRRGRWMPVAVSFAALPMVVYLNGAINPNGVEILAGLALTVSLLRLLEWYGPPQEHPLLRRGMLWTIVAASAIMLANARALGPLWVVLIVALCLVATGLKPFVEVFRRRSSYPWLAAVFVGGVFSIGWTLIGGSLSGQAEKADAPLVDASFLKGAAYMLRATPTFAVQALGYFGWFDAPLPGWVLWIAVAALVILVALALLAARRRELITLAVAIGAAVLAPVLIQAYGVHQTGIIWQGRYGLFLYVSVLAIAGWTLSRGGGERIGFLSVRATWTVGALLWVYSCLAFVLVLRRYVVGTATPITQMFHHPAWQPPLGWMTLVAAFAVCSAAFFAFVGLLARRAALMGDPTVDQPAGARIAS